MKSLAIAIVVAATAATARAAPDHEAPDHEGGFGLVAGLGAYGTPLIGAYLGADVKIGARIAGPLWLYGMFARYSNHDVEDSGDGPVTALGAGLDMLGCTRSGTACASAGLSLAGFNAQWNNFDDSVEDHGTVWGGYAAPHVGIDVGGDVRFHVATELELGLARRSDPGGNRYVFVGGIRLVAGVMLRF